MIKAYGRHWKRELVDWRNSGLYGVFQRKSKSANKAKKIQTNCWRQRGIYVLYEGYRPVYVGQVSTKTDSNRNIGTRLNEHRKDHFRDRWDRFSWYGICTILVDGTVKDATANQTEKSARVINDLEAIAIFISDPPYNKRDGSLDAIRVEQEGYDDAPLAELSDRTLLEKIFERLDK